MDNSFFMSFTMTTMPGLLFLVRSNEVLLVFATVNVGAYLNSTTSLQEEVADPFVEYNSSLKSSHNMSILFSFSPILFPWLQREQKLLVHPRYELYRYNYMLQVVHDLLPEENTLPKSYYQAKKILCLMGMEYQKIHACPNDFILYRHEFEEMSKCPRCEASRYKVKDDEDYSSDERCCGIFPSFQGLSICLLMETMQKTLHGMQMRETAMEWSVIRLIAPSGRR
ncbi:hypothetical protein D0Y65_030640 [Glycine soja]|uniref:Uncharacterized protein n=1 Tax=Glycine soja TaxID=3848 RepID=A0A445I4K3_GLYSO|nr:hypothetical protein D0Y65_030640 [Glycine soja]